MLALQQILGGLATGAIYATLALALVLINRSTRIVNFAQGQIAVLSTYIAWTLIQAGLPTWLAVSLAIVLAIPLGALVERVVIRRVAKEPELVVIVVTIGLLILLNGVTGFIWSQEIKPFPTLFPSGAIDVAGAAISIESLGIVAVLAVLVIALRLLFFRTRLGLAMRAVADNPESSALSGLHIDRLLMTGWGLAAAVGALAGCLVAPKVYLDPNMMNQILVYALIAVIVGGLESPLGVVMAAGFIGVAEDLAGTYISFIGNDLKIAVPLVLMCAVLMWRPQGLFGKTVKKRV
ncbi:MAG: branched-chain amino acid ABC transporter permease [Rhodoferax sp.]|nr:branched-chain amino acid ABC transporter permease [Rhodoferax sp.]